MDRLSLQAEERIVLGKKVKNLRKSGLLPAHVFGKGIETEHVSVDGKLFLQTFTKVGETGLVDLKIGSEKVRPVLIRDVQYHALTGKPLHIDFYQVNLAEKVKVTVPIEIIGEEPEKVHLGEAIVLQTLNEVEVEALPADLPEKLEVDISSLKEIDDALVLQNVNFDREKITVTIDPEEIVVKLAPAVSAEMEALLEEQAAETAEAQAEAAAESASAEATVDKEGDEGEETAVGEEPDATEATDDQASKEGNEGETGNA